MKSFIRKLLHEALAVPTFNLPKNIELSPESLNRLKNINYRDIEIENTGDNGVNTLYMGVNIKGIDISDSVVFTIQLIQDTYYQPHMFLARELQGIGLGPKILRKFIDEYGHIYAGTGRTLNQDANKMLSKIANDPNIESYSDKNALLLIKKDNPDKNQLLKVIKQD